MCYRWSISLLSPCTWFYCVVAALLFSSFNTLFYRCCCLIVDIFALFYLRSIWAYTEVVQLPWSHSYSSICFYMPTPLLRLIFYLALKVNFSFWKKICYHITAVWLILCNNPYFNVKLLFVSVRIFFKWSTFDVWCMPK